MTFSDPAVLWALPLGAVPLLLHLLSRRRALQVEFSDLSLLRRVQAQALPRTRLRQWLLAGARCAAVTLLIAAYAGPVLEPQAAVPEDPAGAAGPGGGMDLVLLVDRSYSMGVVSQGRTRAAAAREAAAGLLRSLRPYDRVACAAFAEGVETAGPRLDWMTPRACQELIDRSPPGWGATDYGPALRAAYALLVNSRRDRAVLLLSDGAAHGLRADMPPPEPGTGLYCLSWPPPPFNAAVLSARPERAGGTGSSAADQPALRVRLWASADAGSALDLWQERARLGASSVALRGQGETATSLSLPAPTSVKASPDDARGVGAPAPTWSGRVELRPDALPADDACYYSFRHPRRPRLLVLYGDPAFLRSPHAGYFLHDLFAGGGRRLLGWDADFAESDRLSWSGSRLADYDAVALAEPQSLSASAAAALEAYVRQGGGLWLQPPGRGEAAALKVLSRWLPVQVSAAAEPELVQGLRVGPGGPFSSWREFELDKVTLTRRLDLAPRPGGRVWVRAPSGAALLATAGYGAGRVAVWAAPLDAVSGNLPVKPVFAALVSASLSLLREPPARSRSSRRRWASPSSGPGRARRRRRRGCGCAPRRGASPPSGSRTGGWRSPRPADPAST
ncbi:MAG: BatA domain-containing protein [Elusimicrobia bacterium]|nr:BatA domain-containing protein [Elusimicrobiota bacterium]